MQTSYKIFFLILIGLASFSCKEKAVNPDFSYINDSYERWKAYDFQNYTIEQRKDCFCMFGGELVLVKVKNNSVDEVIRISDSTALLAGEKVWYKTVDELFEIIRKINPDLVAQFRAEYDSMYGYPKDFYVDPDAMMADEEYGYRNEKLTKINLAASKIP